MKHFRPALLIIPISLLFIGLLAACGIAGVAVTQVLSDPTPDSEPLLIVDATDEPAPQQQLDQTVEDPTVAPPTGDSAAAPAPTTPPVAAAPSAQVGVGAIAALEGTLVEIYEEVNPSVVHVLTNAGEGSGFVWDAQGHIVTNNHVIENATQIAVQFSDDRLVEATLVGGDAASDLAVLRIDPNAANLRPIQLGDSTALRVGELAIAIGNPFGQQGTMTVGFISAVGRLQSAEGTSFSTADMIQTDAAINPGNSGGVLVDENGFLIGVTSNIISPVRGSTGIGFAIPTALVERVAPSLITNGAYLHPYLGVTGQTITPDVAASLGIPSDTRGTLLVSLAAGGPAAAAGLQAGQQSGDVVVAVDGTSVGSMDELITFLARYATVGEVSTFTVIRNGNLIDVPVTIGARPG